MLAWLKSLFASQPPLAPFADALPCGWQAFEVYDPIRGPGFAVMTPDRSLWWFSFRTGDDLWRRWTTVSEN